MNITENNGIFRVEAKDYALSVSKEWIEVWYDGELTCRLRTASAVNSFENDAEKADNTDFAALAFEQTDKGFKWTKKDGIWDKVEFTITLCECCFNYGVKVFGKGPVDSIDYFIGSKEDDWRGSDYEFDRGYMPIPTVDGTVQNEFPAQKSYDEFSYLTVPPLFCYIFDVCGLDKKVCFGLFAKKGEHNYTKYTYNTHCDGGYIMNRFWLSTDQSCHTVVDGEWEAPFIKVFPAESREAGLRKYADKYFEFSAERKPKSDIPRFWYGPMACGWVEQWAYDLKFDTHFGMVHSCRQQVYDNYLAELKRRDLPVQIMIIDDKWQKQYATAVADEEKWPDLRGWVDKTLAETGIHTMLWYKIWDAEGLPEEATMYSEKDNQRVADPTSPAYRAIVKENMHRLLSGDEGCYNTYGLKLDYAFMQPVGRKSVSYSGAYGVELYYEYLKLIYEAAKEAKPEAIISGSPCHPYLNRYIDHARLHDYHPHLRRCHEEFCFRAMIYSIANPDALIDTDGAGFRTRRDTMRHMLGARKIGIPDLYCITETPWFELSDEDWKETSDNWKEYSAEIDKMYK